MKIFLKVLSTYLLLHSCISCHFTVFIMHFCQTFFKSTQETPRKKWEMTSILEPLPLPFYMDIIVLCRYICLARRDTNFYLIILYHHNTTSMHAYYALHCSSNIVYPSHRHPPPPLLSSHIEQARKAGILIIAIVIIIIIILSYTQQQATRVMAFSERREESGK